MSPLSGRSARVRPRVVAACAAVLLAPTALAGCASQQERYCDALRDAKPDLVQAAKQRASGGEAALDVIPVLEGLSGDAPPELTADWQTVLGALKTFRAAVRSAGLELGPGVGKRLQALPPRQQVAVSEAAARLARPEVLASTRHVEDQAQQVCHVRLNL